MNRSSTTLILIFAVTAACAVAHFALAQEASEVEAQNTRARTRIASNHQKEAVALAQLAEKSTPVERETPALAAARALFLQQLQAQAAASKAANLRPAADLDDNPQARAVWMRNYKDQARLKWGPLLAELKYSPERTEAFFALDERLQSESLDLPAAIETKPDLNGRAAVAAIKAQNDDQVAAYKTFFGTDFPEWQAAQAENRQHWMAAAIAESLTESGDSLDGDQLYALTQILARHAGAPSHGAPRGYYDWSAVTTEVADLLTPSQLAQFKENLGLLQTSRTVPMMGTGSGS